MENVLQIHTEAVSAQIAHFYEVCILIIALLGPVQRQTSYKRLTYITSQLPLIEIHEVILIFISNINKVEIVQFVNTFHTINKVANKSDVLLLLITICSKFPTSNIKLCKIKFELLCSDFQIILWYCHIARPFKALPYLILKTTKKFLLHKSLRHLLNKL